MKRVRLPGFIGLDGKTLDARAESGTVTMRDVFCGCLARMDADAHQSIAAFELGRKISAAKLNKDNEVILEDAEHALLLKAIEQNSPKYVALILAQAYKAASSANTYDAACD